MSASGRQLSTKLKNHSQQTGSRLSGMNEHSAQIKTASEEAAFD